MPARNWQPSRSRRRPLRSKIDPLAIGAPVSSADRLVAIVAADRLSAVLARLHQEGFGPMARVLDANQGDVVERLDRLGIDSDIVLERDGTSSSLLVIQAAGRASMIRGLLVSLGISDALILQQEPDPSAGEVAIDLTMSGETEITADHSG